MTNESEIAEERSKLDLSLGVIRAWTSTHHAATRPSTSDLDRLLMAVKAARAASARLDYLDLPASDEPIDFNF